MAALIFAEPGSSQRQHVLRGDRTTIGRHGENDLVLGDTLVSRRHCIIERRPSGHVLVDLGSTYGTFINEERVEGAKPLQYGDKVRVGKTTMKFAEEIENTKTATTTDYVDAASTDSGTRKQPSIARDFTEAKILADAVCGYVFKAKAAGLAAPEAEAQRLLERIGGLEQTLAEVEQNRVLANTLGLVGSFINQVSELDEVLKITMDHALRALQAERGYILLREGKDVLSVRMTRNMGDIRGFSQSIAESVVATGKSILTTDAQVDPRFSKAQSVMINAIRAVMCVPLRGGEMAEVIGAIFVDGVPGNPMFSERGLQFLSNFASQAATAIEKASLKTKTALEQRRRERLSRYFSGAVIEDILAAGETERLGGDSRTVTLAFTDIRGFTALLEKIKPADAVELLNDYFTDIVDEVIVEEGTLDKFMGDGLMAFWNAPNAQGDHALRAVRAALKMQERVASLVDRWKREGRTFAEALPALSTGIGINTGEAIVGNIGSPKRMEYTAIGDAVNLAARLQGVAKGGEVLVSETTLALVKDKVRWTALAPEQIKGKAHPVPIFRIDGLS